MNTDHYAAIVATPRPDWSLGIVISDDAISSIDFLPQVPSRTGFTALTAEVRRQFQAYFDEPRRFSFELPLAPTGTPYRQRVWAALQAIPAGETMSYGQLARQLGSAPRAIGGACRTNPIPVVIPCHRVLGADGGLGGFMGRIGSGPELDLKAWLLGHERH